MNILYLSLVLFFAPLVVYCILYHYIFNRQKNIEIKKAINFLFVFQNKNDPMYKFFSKYSFYINLLKIFSFAFIPPLCVYIVWIICTLNENPNYSQYLDIFISFNIFFILLFIVPICFIFFCLIKIYFLKKELKKYKLKILMDIKKINLFKIIIKDCPDAKYKNEFLSKIIKSVIESVDNKQELLGDELVKFAINNLKLIDYFLRWFYFLQNMNEINLEYGLQPLTNGLDPFFTDTKFIDKDNNKEFEPEEILKMFLEYVNSFSLNQ